MNLYAGRGVAVREFPLETGYADYLLFVDRKAAGVVEAKAEGIPLAGVAEQAGGYAVGLPANIPHVRCRCPSCTRAPAWKPSSATTATPSRARGGSSPSTAPRRWRTGCAQPDTLRARLRTRCPEHFRSITDNLWPAQVEAIHNLEQLLRRRPAPRADPDGHRQRQDLHRGQLRLPPDQARQSAAGALPGGPQQPGPADLQGVRPVRHPR